MVACFGGAIPAVNLGQPRFREECLPRCQECARGAFPGLHSELSQVAIFHRLGLLVENCVAAFAGLGATPADLRSKEPPPRNRVIVATGHRADAPSRPPPGRFPNTAACIDKAKIWLRQALQAERAETAGALFGIAGGASGVDLLFHEVCKELGIPTKVCLPIPIEDYRRESVADGGPDWVEKFNRFIAENPPIVLSESDDLPAWAARIKDYGVFQRGNIWIMQDGLLRPNADVTLIALWNQIAGEGPAAPPTWLNWQNRTAQRCGTEQRRAVRHRVAMIPSLVT